MLIFVAILWSERARHLLTMRVPRVLGRLSFAIYLLHWPVMMVVGSNVFLVLLPPGHRAAWLLAMVCGVGVTLVIAEAIKKWCDRGAIGFSRRVGRAAAMARLARSVVGHDVEEQARLCGRQ